jgi:hypothetical protein
MTARLQGEPANPRLQRTPSAPLSRNPLDARRRKASALRYGIVMSEKRPDDALVAIYVCRNAAELPVVESLLDEAGIQFMMKGAELQNLLGWDSSAAPIW